MLCDRHEEARKIPPAIEATNTEKPSLSLHQPVSNNKTLLVLNYLHHHQLHSVSTLPQHKVKHILKELLFKSTQPLPSVYKNLAGFLQVIF